MLKYTSSAKRTQHLPPNSEAPPQSSSTADGPCIGHNCKNDCAKWRTHGGSAKATEIQNYAEANKAHRFNKAVKAVYGPKSYSTHHVRANDGNTLRKHTKDILSRWVENLKDLPNQTSPVDQSIVDQLPHIPSVSELSNRPYLEEILAARYNLKNYKAPGRDGMPVDIFKYGDNLLLHRLHSFISIALASNIFPTHWKDANIIMIYKKKTDRAICGNSRGISLISAAYKVLARVMLGRLLTFVVDTMFPESQCGFLRARSTADKFSFAGFSNRNVGSNIATFLFPSSTIQMHLKSSILICCCESGANLGALCILWASYENYVLVWMPVSSREARWWRGLVWTAGVKQDCILAPVIFNLFLVAVTLVFCHGISAADGVPIKCSLFQAVTKAKETNDTIFDLHTVFRQCSPAQPHA